MTTPNREYNRVLHALGGSLLDSGLRNSDHRFEWWAPEALPPWEHALGPKTGWGGLYLHAQRLKSCWCL